MKRAIYLVKWLAKYKCEIDGDCFIFTTLEDALKCIKYLYVQAISNITPHNKKEELTIDEYEEEDYPYYYVVREQNDSWEKGWIDEVTIELD